MTKRRMEVPGSLSLSQCRANLPSVLERLPARGVVITKRGRPVAKLIPLAAGTADNRRLFGALKGVLEITGDILSTGDAWNAES